MPLASEFIHDIQIHQPTIEKQAGGEEIETFAFYKSKRSKAFFEGGNETVSSETMQAEQKVRFKIRFDKDITTRMRVLYEGEYYNIKYIEPYKRKGFMFLKTERINLE